MVSGEDRPRVDFLVGERERPRDAMERSYAEVRRRMGDSIDGKELNYRLPAQLRWVPSMTYLSRGLYGVKAWLRRRDRSIIHVHNQRLGMILHLNDFSPAVIVCHDIIESLMPVYRSSFVYRTFIDFYSSGTMKATVITTPSKTTAEDIRKQFRPKDARIEVNYHGVDRSHFSPVDRRIFLDHFNLPTDRKYMLYVGSEQPRKNVPSIVRAFIKARKEFPELTFLKIGKADEIRGHPVRERLMRELDSAGASGHAFFFESMPDELMPAAYSAADVFAFPSLYEGFGMPVLEAMACGAPVVTSNTTAIPEVAGDAAILIDPTSEDALLSEISRVLREPRLRAELSEKGKARAGFFTWDKTAQGLLRIYRELHSQFA